MTTGSTHHKNPEREARIVAYKKKNPDVSATDIAAMFGVSKAYATKALIKAGIRTYRKKAGNG